MDGNNLQLLKQFIQEWSDMYNTKNNDKVYLSMMAWFHIS